MGTRGTGNRQKAGPAKGKRKNAPAVVDKFVIRLPEGLRDQIKTLSEHNRRSMNSEIIMVLEQYIQQASKADIDGVYEANDDASSLIDQATVDNVLQNEPMTDQELSQKLEALPADKKEALLSLLT